MTEGNICILLHQRVSLWRASGRRFRWSADPQTKLCGNYTVDSDSDGPVVRLGEHGCTPGLNQVWSTPLPWNWHWWEDRGGMVEWRHHQRWLRLVEMNKWGLTALWGEETKWLLKSAHSQFQYGHRPVSHILYLCFSAGAEIHNELDAVLSHNNHILLQY